MMKTLCLAIAVGLIYLVYSRPSTANHCIRLKQIYEEIPPTIGMVINEMCTNPFSKMQCELMGKLSLEYTRQKIMELRLKSNCMAQSSYEFATLDEQCAILDELPVQSVKLATKIFSRTSEKQLAQKFGAALSRTLFSLINSAYVNLGCSESN